MRTLFFLGLAVVLTVKSTCVAQEVVGTAVVEGKTVELKSNHTWNFKEAVGVGCSSVRNQVKFCGEAAGWFAKASSNEDATAEYRHDDSNYGEFIVEDVGLNKGMTAEVMRSAALGNAAQVSGVKAAEVPVFADETTTVDGAKGETLIYGITTKGLTVTFYNTVVIEPNDTIQIVTYSIGELTEEGKRLHQEFLAKTRLK